MEERGRAGGRGGVRGGVEHETERRERTANQLQISEAERGIKQRKDGERKREGGGRRARRNEEAGSIRRSDTEDWQCLQPALTTHFTAADREPFVSF